MKKIFTNDKFYAIVTWFAAFGSVISAIDVFLFYKDPIYFLFAFERIMIGVGLAISYIAYKKHSKNVMKGMIGAALSCLVTLGAAVFFTYILLEGVSAMYIISSIFAFVLVLVLFINHFIINSDHHSRPANIMVNQILSLVLAILMCVESVSTLPYCVNAFDTITIIINCFGQPFGIFSIICIESRLDAYRKNREDAGWTEKEGYPDGYVHQYEKK